MGPRAKKTLWILLHIAAGVLAAAFRTSEEKNQDKVAPVGGALTDLVLMSTQVPRVRAIIDTGG